MMQNALFRPVSEFLAERTGLHFPPERRMDLERGLSSAAKALGFREEEDCARWLLSGSPDKDAIETLASYLTVGETYFFRDMKIFDALEHSVLPGLLKRPSPRIWCAGCCTGEEPYSIAMLLDRIAPARQDIQILATDVNPRFLEKAVQGIYGRWSFRNTTPPWISAAYFKQNGSEYELLPRIRNRVRFDKLNLATDPYPEYVDIIFCRNVLMYFSPQKQEMVAKSLALAAADKGWLVVSPTEISDSLFSGFERIDFRDASFYRKRAFVPAPPMIRFEPEIVPVKPADVDQPRDACAMARQCADSGNLEAAADWCERAIEADPVDAARHYLFATILHEIGRPDDEADALRRVVYLEPDFVLAHFALGNLCLARDRNDEAMRHFENASAILKKLPREAVIPESEGMAAGRLADIIGSLRRRSRRGKG